MKNKYGIYSNISNENLKKLNEILIKQSLNKTKKKQITYLQAYHVHF